MTESDMDELAEDLRGYLDRQGAPRREKRGIFGKVVVLMCLLSGLGVCAAYFGFCWISSTAPSEAIVAAMLAYTYGELWHCRKIKESKTKESEQR